MSGLTTAWAYGALVLATTLELSTSPPGATVSIAQKNLELQRVITPATLNLAPGRYNLKYTLSEHRSRSKHLKLGAAKQKHTECLDHIDQRLFCRRLINVPGKAKSVWVSEDGSRSWAALLPKGPSLVQVNTIDGRQLSEHHLGRHGAVEMVFSGDKKSLWASQMQSDRVYEIELGGNTARRVFNTGGRRSKYLVLSDDETKLYVSNWVSNDISEIDVQSGELLRRIPTVRTPRGMYLTANGEDLYVAGFGRGQLAHIDLNSGRSRIVARTGGALRHIVGDEPRALLYVSDMKKGEVLKFSLIDESFTPLCKTLKNPNTIQLSSDGNMLFVSTRGRNGSRGYKHIGEEWGALMVFGTRDGRLLDAVVAGNQPTALALSADGKTLVSSDYLDRVLRVYDVPPADVLLASENIDLSRFSKRLKKRVTTLKASATDKYSRGEARLLGIKP